MRAAILLGLTFLTSAHAAWSPALAPNGSFEIDDNRDGLPDHWTPALFKSPGQAIWDRQTAHTGAASVRIQDGKGPAGGDWQTNVSRWVLDDEYPCRAGETLTLTGWIRTALTEGHASLAIAWFADSRWLAEDNSDKLTGQADWTQRTVSAAAPATATRFRIYLMTSGTVGSVWFDDLAASRGGTLPGNYRPIDLSAACNTGFRDEVAGDGQGGWTDQGEQDLRGVPTGRQTLRGVPFSIGPDCIVLKGRGVERYPTKADIAVNAKADVLYFLHAVAWAGKAAVAFSYRIDYADGSAADVPITNGREVSDWWQPQETEDSAIGWQSDVEGNSGGLVIFPWTNPHPERTIRSVTITATGGQPIPILAAITAADGPAVLAERRVEYEFTDTTGWYAWDFDETSADLGELDLSATLDAPAGKHGFTQIGADGHLVFADGTQARFFGTNVGGSAIAPEKDQAPIIAGRLAAFGVNLLRLHIPDSTWGGLIDMSRDDTRELDPAALDRYDYFVNELLQRGIYVYFDLLDYRKFKPGDGVREADDLGTSWSKSIKGASIFDRPMIELQKEFATKLLTHRNPYTGRRYVDEPGLALQEITNENSLFYLANTDLMLPSYVEDLRQIWNRWLVEKYGDRAKLAAAWKGEGGEDGLLPAEDPAKGSVAMPLGRLYDDLRNKPRGGETSPARLNDMTSYLYELERSYYREMVEHLRGLGLKCAITGTNQDFSDASNRANAYTDAMTRNNYWCHPNVHATPPTYRNLSLLRSDLAETANPIAEVASSTVAGKPMIVPEFNAPWPNEYRAEMLPLMTLYGRLQDWDGLLYFAYHRPGREALEYFTTATDPVRWAQMPMASLIFLRGDFDVARTSVEVGVSLTDTFGTRQRRVTDRYSPYRVLPYLSKVRNRYFDEVYTGDADVVVSSGHSATGDYSQAKRAMVFADWPYTDIAARQRDRGASARLTVPGLKTNGDALEPASLPQGATPITAGGQTVGFLDDRHWVYPAAADQDDPAWLHRAWLTAAQRWKLPSAAPAEEAGQVFRSDTGQLVWNCEEGVLLASSPRAKLLCGLLAEGSESAVDGFAARCTTRFASLSLVSLDGLPTPQSKRLLLTAVARAENTGQAALENRRVLAQFGQPPILAEPVYAKVEVTAGAALRAYPLDPRGRKTGRTLPVKVVDGRLVVELQDAQSPWILLAE